MRRLVFTVSVVLTAVLAAGFAAVHRLGVAFAMGIHPVPDGTPWTYQFESGFVPALTVLTLLGSVISLYHIHNCHSEKCWRLGKHRVNGLPWCRRHAALVTPETTDHELLAQISGLLEEIRDRL